MDFNVIALLVGAAATIIGVSVTNRQTQFSELRELYKILKQDFEDYKEDKQIEHDKMEVKIVELEKYIIRLIGQLKENNIAPVEMEQK